MTQYFFKLSVFHKKIETNRTMSYVMKGIAALLLFTVAFCSITQPADMKIAWYLLIPAIWLMFCLDLYFVKQNKKLEYQIYELETQEQEEKKCSQKSNLSIYRMTF